MRLEFGQQLFLAAEPDHAVNFLAVLEHDHGRDAAEVEPLPDAVELSAAISSGVIAISLSRATA
jgi:hypothetical protein